MFGAMLARNSLRRVREQVLVATFDDIDSANGVAAIAPWLGLDRIINT